MKPDRIRQALAGEPLDQSSGAASTVGADQDLASGALSGQLREDLSDDGDVVGGGCWSRRLPGLGRIAKGSPVPSGPWSPNAPNGWNPKPRVNVGAVFPFSECAVTRVASQACSRAAALAVSMAFKALLTRKECDWARIGHGSGRFALRITRSP